MPEMTDQMRDFIATALADGVPCLLATVDAQGRPNISPKGSVMVFDGQHLAYWERSKRMALANVNANPNVCVFYRNPAKGDEMPIGATWRFYGTAEVHDGDDIHAQVKSRTVQPELDRDTEGTGVAVLVKVSKILDLRGNEL